VDITVSSLSRTWLVSLRARVVPRLPFEGPCTHHFVSGQKELHRIEYCSLIQRVRSLAGLVRYCLLDTSCYAFSAVDGYEDRPTSDSSPHMMQLKSPVQCYEGAYTCHPRTSCPRTFIQITTSYQRLPSVGLARSSCFWCSSPYMS